ncbi:hypothetical protein G5714_004450 [Onychostoma macrolepis]|uniref:Uncharacterized protein n=1 Tax=Onychostoma macrolepis TaxID=369639 RepID=A0A7J6D4S5_9TELE|nr:hypothetical protein G5714_004450 [Onychostoma macrolepis]
MGSLSLIIDQQIQEEELEIIGVSERHDKLILLDSRLDDYVVPAHFYAGDPDDLVNQLPLKLKVRHIQRHVLKIECLDSPKSEESLNLLQDGASLDPGQSGESPDPLQAAASIDLDQNGESLDPAESMESLDPID